MPATQPDWIQYGSFGLIAFLVIAGMPAAVYAVWQITNYTLEQHRVAIETLTDKHEAAVAGLVASSERESLACREERRLGFEKQLVDADKERVSRHELALAISLLAGKVEILMDRTTNP